MTQYISIHKKYTFLAQVFLLYVVPIILLYFDIIPKVYRMLVLSTVGLVMYGVIRKNSISLKDLGFVLPKKREIYTYIFWLLASVLFIVLYAYVFNFKPPLLWWRNPHFWLFFIFVSFVQEFAYRGFLNHILKQIHIKKFLRIFFNVILFTLLHSIFPHPQVSLPLAFIGGLFFSLVYEKYPNMYLIVSLHACLNFVAVYYGFFLLLKG